MSDLRTSTAAAVAVAAAGASASSEAVEPAAKKRKLDDGLPILSAAKGPANGVAAAATATAIVNGGSEDVGAALLLVKDISLVMPQRKKYTLEFTASNIRALHPETKEPIPGISYAWKDIGRPSSVGY